MASCWKDNHCAAFRCRCLLLLLFVLLFVLTAGSAGAEVTNSSVIVRQIDGQFDTGYLDTVTSHEQIIYTFNHTVTRNKVRPEQQQHHGHHVSKTTSEFREP
ncbi:SID1 transmembrane family member 2 isoform X1, partial [Clarias magur]